MVLEEEVKKEDWANNDIREVYDRILIYLNPRAEINGLDIAKGCWGGYPQPSSDLHREWNKKRFTSEVIRDVAFNQFSRYVFYDLMRSSSVKTGFDILPLLKKQIGEYANDKMKKISGVLKEMESVGAKVCLPEGVTSYNWFCGLSEVAEKISRHWGTPLEAVE